MKIGRCHICLEEKQLSFEHFPSEKCFNSGRVKIGDTYSQRGIGDYTLCERCNNITGKWYNNDYLKFVAAVHRVIAENDDEIRQKSFTGLSITIDGINPLLVAKQMLSYICSILPYHILEKYNFKNLLLDKYSTIAESDDFELFVSLYLSGDTGVIAKGPIILDNGCELFWLCSYPFSILFATKKGLELRGFSSINKLLISNITKDIRYTFNIAFSQDNLLDFISNTLEALR